ncbi:hypothetical protein D3C87_1204200 [compost metagenome]
MNAIQARQQAEKALDKRTDQSLISVEREIKKAVKKGEFYCYRHDFISEFAKQILIGQGYKIEYELQDRVGEYAFKISW